MFPPVMRTAPVVLALATLPVKEMSPPPVALIVAGFHSVMPVLSVELPPTFEPLIEIAVPEVFAEVIVVVAPVLYASSVP